MYYLTKKYFKITCIITRITLTTTLFCSVLTLFLINDVKSQVQNSKASSLKAYLDPICPFFSVSEEKSKSNENLHTLIIEEYLKKQGPFPLIENTGNSIEDEKNYQTKLDEWFRRNPYFPIIVSTNGSTPNEEATFEAKKEWIKRNPEKYKELFDLVYSDEKLRKEYLSKIKIK